MIWNRTQRIGLAIDRTRLLAVSLEDNAPADRTVLDEAWDSTAADRRAQLSGALKRIRGQHSGRTELFVALLPPLAEARFVPLPPLSSDDLRPVLARDLSRYLPIATAAQVVQVDEPAASAPAASALRKLTVADEGLIEDIIAAAGSSGWEIRSIVGALSAWMRAARAKGEGRTDRWTMIALDDRTDAFRVSAPGTIVYRRFRRSSPVADPPGDLPGDLLAANQEAALRLAARYSEAAAQASLWPERVRLVWVASAWRSAKITAAAALLVLVLSAALAWRGTASALQRTEAARAAIAVPVQVALARRDSLLSLERAVERLRGFDADTPDWLALIAGVERALPDDAFLLAMRGVRDTLVLTGEAERAAPVLEALSLAPGFSDVRLDAPIQQQVEEGEVIAERFTLLVQPRPRAGRP